MIRGTESRAGWGETPSSPDYSIHWEIRARRSLAPPFIASTQPQGRAGCPQPAGPRRGEDTAPYPMPRFMAATHVQSLEVLAFHEPRIYRTNLCCTCNTDLSRLDELSVRPGVGRDSVEP